MILPVTSSFSHRIRKECPPSDGAPAKSVALALCHWTHLAAFSLMFVLLAFTAHAQVYSAISGIVEDPSGAGVSGAKVVLRMWRPARLAPYLAMNPATSA